MPWTDGRTMDEFRFMSSELKSEETYILTLVCTSSRRLGCDVHRLYSKLIFCKSAKITFVVWRILPFVSSTWRMDDTYLCCLADEVHLTCCLADGWHLPLFLGRWKITHPGLCCLTEGAHLPLLLGRWRMIRVLTHRNTFSWSATGCFLKQKNRKQQLPI